MQIKDNVAFMEKLFNSLAEILQTLLPENWKIVHLYSEISQNSYDTSFYCKIKGSCNYIHCYSFEELGISEKAVDDAVEKLSEVLKTFWTNSKDKWTNCTFSLYSEGDFNFDIDYTDLTNCTFEYRENWKAKYLK